jgi:hypothetical protein
MKKLRQTKMSRQIQKVLKDYMDSGKTEKDKDKFSKELAKAMGRKIITVGGRQFIGLKSSKGVGKKIEGRIKDAQLKSNEALEKEKPRKPTVH